MSAAIDNWPYVLAGFVVAVAAIAVYSRFALKRSRAKWAKRRDDLPKSP